MAANASGPDCERSARSIIAVTAKRPLVVSRIESLLRPCCCIAARVAIRAATKLGLPTVLSLREPGLPSGEPERFSQLYVNPTCLVGIGGGGCVRCAPPLAAGARRGRRARLRPARAYQRGRG